MSFVKTLPVFLLLCIVSGCQSVPKHEQVFTASNQDLVQGADQRGIAFLPFNFAGDVNAIVLRGEGSKISLVPKMDKNELALIYRLPAGHYCFDGYSYIHGYRRVSYTYKNDLCFDVQKQAAVVAPMLYEQGKKMVFLADTSVLSKKISAKYGIGLPSSPENGASNHPIELELISADMAWLPGQSRPKEETYIAPPPSVKVIK